MTEKSTERPPLSPQDQLALFLPRIIRACIADQVLAHTRIPHTPNPLDEAIQQYLKLEGELDPELVRNSADAGIIREMIGIFRPGLLPPKEDNTQNPA